MQQEQSFFHQNSKFQQINARVSAAVKGIPNKNNHNEIVLFLWNGKRVILNDQNYPQSPELTQERNVITDALLIGENRYYVFSQSDGQLFINKNNSNQPNDNISSSSIIIQNQQKNIYQAFCKLAFFQSKNQRGSLQSQCYLLAVDYNFKISVFKSTSIENFSSSQRYIFDGQYIYVQYDEINQVFLALDEKFQFLCVRINPQNQSLEICNIALDLNDIANLGIEKQDDFLGFDFQYQQGKINIYVLGKMIGIFSANFQDIDESQNTVHSQITFFLDPFAQKQCQGCDKNYIQIFSDKRKFESQELTIVYDKVIIKLYPLIDEKKIIFDSRKNNLNDQNFNINKYICFYGSNQNVSQHLLIFTNCQKIDQSFNENTQNKVFISYEQ